MIEECMFAYSSLHSLDSLFLEMFVEFFNNAVVTRHKIWWVIPTLMGVHKAVYVEAFLAFHTMHCTGLITVL